jgi:hypothetical protein
VAQRDSRRTVLPCLCICIPPLCLSVVCVWWSVVTRGTRVDWQCRIPQPRPRTIAPPSAANQGGRPAIARQRREQTGLGMTRSGLGSTVGRVHRTGNRGGDCLPTEGRQPGSDQLAEWGVGTLQDGKARPEGITA